MEHVSLSPNAINILQGYISSKFSIRENFFESFTRQTGVSGK